MRVSDASPARLIYSFIHFQGDAVSHEPEAILKQTPSTTYAGNRTLAANGAADACLAVFTIPSRRRSSAVMLCS